MVKTDTWEHTDCFICKKKWWLLLFRFYLAEEATVRYTWRQHCQDCQHNGGHKQMSELYVRRCNGKELKMKPQFQNHFSLTVAVLWSLKWSMANLIWIECTEIWQVQLSDHFGEGVWLSKVYKVTLHHFSYATWQTNNYHTRKFPRWTSRILWLKKFYYHVYYTALLPTKELSKLWR